MEIKHPDMDYIPVTVKKAKIDTDGNIVYLDETCKLPKTVVDALVDKEDAPSKDQ